VAPNLNIQWLPNPQILMKAAYFLRNVEVPFGFSQARAHASARPAIRM